MKMIFTSTSAAAVGNVVIAEGKLELDKDYKYGYLYPVLIENATMLLMLISSMI